MLFCPKCGTEVIECTANCQVEVTPEIYLHWNQEMGYCENCEYVFEVVPEECYKGNVRIG